MSIDIDAIEARANAATPGPWGIEALHALLRFGRKNDGWWDQYEEIMPVDGDEEFVVSARQDVPALCAEVRDLRAALEQARALLAELAACGYECQAGALENNQAYRELAALLAAAPGGAA